ncbi:uncharacterized protein QC761_0013510 [Podospora bellae-mahoneyi]|uniref:Uncharacterized protein n=1 Tax=Podospora bellae-mahoneyi TaxID=2093777 RepID=A0ABR0FYY8_9PEZI|nr:hypothetical protein QC761_0013510 [Podospora bellae-mahoneyi]
MQRRESQSLGIIHAELPEDPVLFKETEPSPTKERRRTRSQAQPWSPIPAQRFVCPPSARLARLTLTFFWLDNGESEGKSLVEPP